MLSPFLFSLFSHDLPILSNLTVKNYTYADVLTTASQHLQEDETAIELQTTLKQLEERLIANHMSAADSMPLFTVVTPFKGGNSHFKIGKHVLSR